MPLLKKKLFSLSKFRTSYPSDTTNGIRAIVRALLMATVNSRWCLAQFPVIRRGMILPLSVVKSLSV